MFFFSFSSADFFYNLQKSICFYKCLMRIAFSPSPSHYFRQKHTCFFITQKDTNISLNEQFHIINHYVITQPNYASICIIQSVSYVTCFVMRKYALLCKKRTLFYAKYRNRLSKPRISGYYAKITGISSDLVLIYLFCFHTNCEASNLK